MVPIWISITKVESKIHISQINVNNFLYNLPDSPNNIQFTFNNAKFFNIFYLNKKIPPGNPNGVFFFFHQERLLLQTEQFRDPTYCNNHSLMERLF